MPNVVSEIELRDWKKDDGTVVKVSDVTFIDGSMAPGYDLPAGLEVGKPLPAGWEVTQSKAGKPYIKVPKQGGGGGQAAFRNTKEGFLLEQQGYYRKDERMDRRTALMQAVALVERGDLKVGPDTILTVAKEMYAWLRATSGSGAGSGTLGRAASDPDTSSPASGPSGLEGPVEGSAGDAPEEGDRADGGSPLSPLWYDLYDLTEDKPAARRAVTRANKRTSPVTPQNESEVTDVEIQAAIDSLKASV